MRILFLGGTRFIGLAAVEHLVQQGHLITVFHRGQTNPYLPASVDEILGDLADLEDFAGEFDHLAPDAVVHTMLRTGQDAERFMRVFKDKTERVVGLSSADVYQAYGRMIGFEPGDPVDLPLTENSPLRETRFPYRNMTDDADHWMYHYDKIPAEEALLGDPGLPGTVLRLPIVYGPRDYQRRIYGYLKRMDDKRPAILMDANYADWCTTRGYVENVAAAIALAVTNPRAAGRIYNVAEKVTFSEFDWVDRIAEMAGWDGEIIAVEPEALPEEMQMDFNGQDLILDSRRIREELGYAEVIGLSEAIRRTIEWDRLEPPENLQPEMFDYEAEDKVLASLD